MRYANQQIIDLALSEDIGTGDITTENLIEPDQLGRGQIVAKEQLVVAGIEVAEQVFKTLERKINFKAAFNDGDLIHPGTTVITIDGSMQALLMGERTALNFLQRLSGIATHVRNFVESMDNPSLRLTDTRKTTPGLRHLEKYAVRIGGAQNHRMALYDGVLIKDNHIAACGGITQAVTRIKSKISHLIKIEVEVSDLMQVEEAVVAGVDVIMLDNMDLEMMKTAVQKIDKKALIEVSGGIKRKDLKALDNIGIDIVSSGALTHSATAVDLSMRIE